MSRRRSLSDEERALWTGHVRSVAPLHRSRESASAPEIRPELPRASPRRASDDGESGKRAPPLTPLGRRLKQRVARGRQPIDACLDLHGFTQTEAQAALLRFLRRAQADGAKVVLVVTGKGRGTGSDQPLRDDATAERGVLKRRLPMWLALPEFRALVVGFEVAHVGHGGEGALYIRLRRTRSSSR